MAPAPRTSLSPLLGFGRSLASRRMFLCLPLWSDSEQPAPVFGLRTTAGALANARHLVVLTQLRSSHAKEPDDEAG